MLTVAPQLSVDALRVLIVDHHKDAAASMAMLIRQCGHSARAAFGALEALEVAGDYRPNIVLIDHALGPVVTVMN